MSFSGYNFPSDHPTRSYQSGQVTVGTSPTLIVAAAGNQSGVVINNGAGAIVYLGGPAVTISTGLPVGTGSTVVVPANGGTINNLYGVVQTTPSIVGYLYPSQ